MNSFSIVFFLFWFFAYYILCQLSNSFYLFSFFSLFRSFSPPFSLHFLGTCICSLPFFSLSFHPFSLISSLNSRDYSYQVVFRKPGPSPVVSLLVPSSLWFIHVCRINTWAEHISFTFMLYAFISHHSFDFHPKRLPWENAILSYCEFINCNTQRHMLWSYWLNVYATSSMLR